jgi:hypothetical protein
MVLFSWISMEIRKTIHQTIIFKSHIISSFLNYEREHVLKQTITSKELDRARGKSNSDLPFSTKNNSIIIFLAYLSSFYLIY